MKKLTLLVALVVFVGNLHAQITAEFTSAPFSNCGGAGSTPVNVAFLDQSTSPGGAITNWLWDFGDGTTSLVASPVHVYSLAGNYTVCLTVTNTANENDTECKTNYVSISDIPVCTIIPPDDLDCNVGIVTIDGSLSTFGPNIVYEWRDENFQVLGFTPTLDVTAPGAYTLKVTETLNSCSAEATVQVEQDIDPPVLHIPVTSLNDTIYNCQEDIFYSTDLVSDCPNCLVEIRDANDVLICDELPCVFQWGPFLAMGIIPEFPFYINAINNDNGCYTSDLLPTPNPSSNSISWNITDESCNGSGDGNIDLTASGTGEPFTFDWEDLPGTNDPLDRTGLTAGNYTLHVTDVVGCEITGPDGIEIEVKSYPIADASATNNVDTLTCTSPSVSLPIILDGSNSSTGANLIYRWYDSNFNLVGDSIVSEISSFDFDGYTLIVTDTVAQCSNSTMIVWDIFEDNVVPSIVVDPFPSPILSCVVDTVFLDASGSTGGTGPFVFEWFNSLGSSISTDTILEVTQEGEYILTLTDNDNGCTSTQSFFVEEDTTPPIADAGPDLILTCSNTSVDLDGSASSSGPNFTYEWFDPNNNSISFTQNATVTQPGVYTLIVTDITNGCTASDTVIVDEDTSVPAFSINATTLVCPGELVTIDMSPPCTNCTIEILDNMGNPICTTGLPCEIDPTGSPFQVTVTDLSTGCQNTESFTISVPDPIQISSSTITNPTCFGDNDGSIDIEVTGGSPPYEFVWSNGSVTEDLVNLADGNYTITIIDVNGCVIEESFMVGPTTPLEITDVQITNVSCTGTNDGSIEVTVAGGTGNYSYLWSNGSTSNIITDLPPGNHTVTITDGNNCFLTSPEYTIIQNACFTFANDTTICLGETAQLSNESPVTDWSYEWTPAIGLNDSTIPNPIASPAATTTYFLTITDGNGTVIFNAEGPTITVQNYQNFSSLNFSNSPLCEGDTLELYGNTGLVFAWTGPNNFTSSEMDPLIYNVTEDQGGIYSLLMTDEFGCTAMADVDVFIDDDCVWPGDTDTNLVVNHFDLLNIGLAYDSVGTTRENASFDWVAQPSLDWPQSTPSTNVNYKHIDADGNGIIEAADTLAITQNFGLTHNFSAPIDNQFTDLPPADGTTVVTPFYVEPDTLIEGETMALDIVLGDVSNVVMGLYGIGFSLEYDSSVVVPGSAYINFDDCWLGDVDADAISIQFDFPNPGRIDAAITRIDGMEMDGYGLFGELIITLEDDILLWDGNGSSNNFGGTTNDVFADFSITNYHLINFSQEEILVEGMTTSAPIDGTTSLSSVELNQLISVFPNPANDLFYIASQNIDIERVRIFSATGDLKSVKTKTGNNLEFSTKELASGIYFIEIQTREGIVTKKLNVVR